MINNVYELLSQVNKIKGTEAKTKFIMNYFLENVRYDYAYLFAKGYAQGTITGVSSNFTIALNKTKNKSDEEFALTRSIIQGESRIFNDILRIRDENSEDYNQFIQELRSYITKELKSHLGNDDLVTQNVDLVMKQIEQGLREKTKIIFNGNEYAVNYDISKVLIDFLIEPKKYFPPQFQNGLITSGVCEDYATYLVPLLQKAGIEAHEVEGTSELGHAWVIIKDEEKYKSIDLTRAVFIRDGFLGIPPEQTSKDWLYSNLEDIFKMQKTRTITKIDQKTLPHVINGQNFDEESFIRLMEEEISDSSFRNIIKKGFEKGITAKEVLNANQAENTKEREGKVSE